MRLSVQIEQEDDGRWIAEVPDLPGVLACGATPAEAVHAASTLAFRVIAEKLEHGELKADTADAFQFDLPFVRV